MNLEYLYWIMATFSLLVACVFYYTELTKALSLRKIGWKLWGFNKIENPYHGTREYVNKKTSWHCKAVSLGNSYELFWSLVVDLDSVHTSHTQ